MDVSARLTSKGQVTIPRSVREALGLSLPPRATGLKVSLRLAATKLGCGLDCRRASCPFRVGTANCRRVSGKRASSALMIPSAAPSTGRSSLNGTAARRARSGRRRAMGVPQNTQ